MPAINGRACVVNGTPVDKVFSNGRQVYGRNLLTGTRDFDNWYVYGTKVAVTNDQGTFQAATGALSSGEPYCDVASRDIYPLGKNTDYTASFWVKASENADITSYLYGSGYVDVATVNQATTDYTRVVVHFHNGNNTATPIFIPARIFKTGVTVWVYGCKLEKGATATPWTPAPEDVGVK